MAAKTMTRRQRVLAAINHQVPDRMPIDLGAHFSTGISAFAYRRLREHLGLDTAAIEVPDMVQMLARVDLDVLERFHCDAMLLNPPWRRPVRWTVRGDDAFWISDRVRPERNGRGEWIVRRDGQSMRMPVGGFFFDGAWLAARDYDTDDEELAAYAARAEYIYKQTDFFTLLMGFSGYFDGLDFACLMLTDPDEALAHQRRALDRNLRRVERVIRTFGRYIQAIEVNSDLGAQNAPLVRPGLYAEMCAPYLKQFVDFVHQNSDIKVMMHSCGSVEPLIPHIIEAGVDILNPVQISAANMEPAALKRKYGDQICFWGGGCDTQSVLPSATPAEVAAHVREVVAIFKPGGGYVFNQVHNIMGNVPPENVVAMLDAAYAESAYS
ncbi:MAG: hypothetical protein GX558_04450 [Clostridiales bacterium]|nr:hypothetical protein [Clostridiales bacterium]